MSVFEPPAGVNFHCEGMIPFEIFSRDLCRIVAYLQECAPEDILQLFDDRWQVDGHHFTKGHLDFAGLYELIASPGSVYQAAPGDACPRLGVAPLDRAWYLRFLVSWDGEGAYLAGSYDLTLGRVAAAQFIRGVGTQLEVQLQQVVARRYYADIGFRKP